MTKFKTGDVVSIRTMRGRFACTRKGRVDADFEEVGGTAKVVTLRREYFSLITKEAS